MVKKRYNLTMTNYPNIPMKKSFALALAALFTLQACVPMLVGGAATTAVVADDRRSAGQVLDDKSLQLQLESKIANIKRLAGNSHVNVTVYNGIVLLTGEAANEAIRQDIAKLCGSYRGVRRVDNYLIIGPRSSFMNRSYDTSQTAKVRTVLFDVKTAGFNPNYVKVVTEHGVTYLMGILTTQEANAVVDVVRRVSGVAGVQSLFEIDESRGRAAPEPFANEPKFR